MTLAVDFQKAAIQQHPADYLCCFFYSQKEDCVTLAKGIHTQTTGGAACPLFFQKKHDSQHVSQGAGRRYRISWELLNDGDAFLNKTLLCRTVSPCSALYNLIYMCGS